MKICTECFKEKELTDFYQVKQASGKYTYRAKCKDCFINKEKNRYYIKIGRKGKYRLAFCTTCNEWKVKAQHFAFDDTKCNACVKNALETIVEPVVEIVEEHTEETISPEFTPLELESEPLYTVCETCGLERLKIEYYKSNRKNCISCLLIKRKKLSIEQQDGTQWAVLQAVGTYQCDEQFEALKVMMNKIGWEYEPNGTNDYDGTWHKPGFKDKDGNFAFIKSVPITRKKRGYSSKTGKSKLDGKYEEIKALREQGYIYKDIAEMLNCCHTTLRSFVRRHKLLNKSEYL